MCAVPCYILQGIAPDVYKWANEFPFLSEKGSTVLMLVSLADGNYVKPCFGCLIYSF